MLVINYCGNELNMRKWKNKTNWKMKPSYEIIIFKWKCKCYTIAQTLEWNESKEQRVFVNSRCVYIAIKILHNCYFNQTAKLLAIINRRGSGWWLVSGAEQNKYSVKCALETKHDARNKYTHSMTLTHNETYK